MEIVSVRCETNIIEGCGSVMDVKIKKSRRVNFCVGGFLVVKKCGGLSAVQVVTQTPSNTSREQRVMN